MVRPVRYPRGCPDARERAGPGPVGEEETQAQRARARRDNPRGQATYATLDQTRVARARSAPPRGSRSSARGASDPMLPYMNYATLQIQFRAALEF